MYDPYKILGVNQNSNIEDIKKAYKKLAFKYHPDRNLDNIKEAEQKFKEISKAYTILLECDGKYSYSSFDSPSKFQTLFKKAQIFKNLFNFDNFKIENLTNNILKEVVMLSRYIKEEKNENLKKGHSLNINAKIALFDIYHNINQTIKIKKKKDILINVLVLALI